MQINRENLEKLLSLNDFQLKMVINRIATEGGIDPKEFNIDPSSIGSATDEDLARIAEQFAGGKGGKKR